MNIRSFDCCEKLDILVRLLAILLLYGCVSQDWFLLCISATYIIAIVQCHVL